MLLQIVLDMLWPWCWASIVVRHEVAHALDCFSLIVDNKKQSSGTNKFICHVWTCQDAIFIVVNVSNIGERRAHDSRRDQHIPHAQFWQRLWAPWPYDHRDICAASPLQLFGLSNHLHFIIIFNNHGGLPSLWHLSVNCRLLKLLTARGIQPCLVSLLVASWKPWSPHWCIHPTHLWWLTLKQQAESNKACSHFLVDGAPYSVEQFPINWKDFWLECNNVAS